MVPWQENWTPKLRERPVHIGLGGLGITYAALRVNFFFAETSTQEQFNQLLPNLTLTAVGRANARNPAANFSTLQLLLQRHKVAHISQFVTAQR